jgi:hypothetical protein
VSFDGAPNLKREVFKACRRFDDLLRVETSEKAIIVGVKRYTWTRNSDVVRTKVERLTIPLVFGGFNHVGSS